MVLSVIDHLCGGQRSAAIRQCFPLELTQDMSRIRSSASQPSSAIAGAGQHLVDLPARPGFPGFRVL